MAAALGTVGLRFVRAPRQFVACRLLTRQPIGTVTPITSREFTMVYGIFSHTPSWVWALLALLLGLGWKQSRPGHYSLNRTAAMPLAMVGLSVYGTVSAFGATPQVLSAWCAAALPLAWALLRTELPHGTHYDAALRRFSLAGSWTPMVLIMGIFLTKYTVGVALAMEPARAQEPVFALVAALLYGGFSGCFLGRGARLWRLAAASHPATSRPMA